MCLLLRGSPGGTLTDLCKRNAPEPVLQPPRAKVFPALRCDYCKFRLSRAQRDAPAANPAAPGGALAAPARAPRPPRVPRSCRTPLARGKSFGLAQDPFWSRAECKSDRGSAAPARAQPCRAPDPPWGGSEGLRLQHGPGRLRKGAQHPPARGGARGRPSHRHGPTGSCTEGGCCGGFGECCSSQDSPRDWKKTCSEIGRSKLI